MRITKPNFSPIFCFLSAWVRGEKLFVSANVFSLQTCSIEEKRCDCCCLFISYFSCLGLILDFPLSISHSFPLFYLRLRESILRKRNSIKESWEQWEPEIPVSTRVVCFTIFLQVGTLQPQLCFAIGTPAFYWFPRLSGIQLGTKESKGGIRGNFCCLRSLHEIASTLLQPQTTLAEPIDL